MSVTEEEKPGWGSLPIGAVLLTPGAAVRNKTGTWRLKRPLLDEKKCTNCLLCWIYCPEPAIARGAKTIQFVYDYCKGCGICATECPTKAISMTEES
jgi:pyruvate ferredoxin oxidoreductase delta subunit